MTKRLNTPPMRRWNLSTGLLLAFALHLYAFASMVSTVLGPTHFHTEAAAPRAAQELMAGWQDFRRAQPLRGPVVHRHDHTTLVRHHHDAGDASIVRVGADERDGPMDDAAASGLPPLVLALLGSALPIPVSLMETRARWSTREACAFASCTQRRRDRPPIA